MYKVMGKSLFYELYDLVKFLVMTCDDKIVVREYQCDAPEIFA